MRVTRVCTTAHAAVPWFNFRWYDLTEEVDINNYHNLQSRLNFELFVMIGLGVP